MLVIATSLIQSNRIQHLFDFILVFFFCFYSVFVPFDRRFIGELCMEMVVGLVDLPLLPGIHNNALCYAVSVQAFLVGNLLVRPNITIQTGYTPNHFRMNCYPSIQTNNSNVQCINLSWMTCGCLLFCAPSTHTLIPYTKMANIVFPKHYFHLSIFFPAKYVCKKAQNKTTETEYNKHITQHTH